MPLGDDAGAIGTRKGDVSASRRLRLKAATQEAHDHVEAVVQAAGMTDSRQGWLAYCEATYAARAEAEHALDAAGAEQVLPGWPGRRIACLLEADIADLGGVADRGEPLQIAGPGELLGALYVIEGSALGARLVMQSAAGMGFTREYGARHLHAQAGEGWRAFVAALEQAPLDAGDEARMMRAADAMFARFAAAYARRGRPA